MKCGLVLSIRGRNRTGVYRFGFKTMIPANASPAKRRRRGLVLPPRTYRSSARPTPKATAAPRLTATGTSDRDSRATTSSPARTPRKRIGPAGSGTLVGGFLWASSETLPLLVSMRRYEGKMPSRSRNGIEKDNDRSAATASAETNSAERPILSH